MMMTLRRLAPLMARATAKQRTASDIAAAAKAVEQRQRERGHSKLARRLGRNAELGRAGAF